MSWVTHGQEAFYELFYERNMWKTELSYDTLKFYCNEGLIPNVKRDKNNYRIFDDNDVAWINSLTCLKNCDMSINEMKEYSVNKNVSNITIHPDLFSRLNILKNSI